MFSKLKNLFTAQSSTGSKSNTETLSTRIDTLLAQGQLSQAFELMKENGHPDVSLLQLQWHTAQQQLEQKLIAVDAFNRTQNRLVYALRAIAEEPSRSGGPVQPLPQEAHTEAPAPEPPQAPTAPGQRSAAIDLLAQNRFKEALELLQHESPDWQSLFQRYVLLQHNQRMGMMAAQDYAQSLEEIQQRVMRLMGPMETSPADKAPALGFVRPTKEEWARAAAELEAGNWQEAITLGQRWDTSWLLLFSRLQRTTRDRQLGVATAADIAEELDRIKWSFESLWVEEAKKWGE